MDRATQEPGSASISEEQATGGPTVLSLTQKAGRDPPAVPPAPLDPRVYSVGPGAEAPAGAPQGPTPSAGSPPRESERPAASPQSFVLRRVLSGVKEIKT